ncbi:UDP-glucose 4-epimerase GalE [Gloeobacter kilaueensis]|uniref:UDP-glucose 4-epimerase n=1 Tax=Gloeobacter kilaueensis (strain ATCC BAA-2537 / CCAP 1431/1 / ULC 316 / JS1) TaxID=1183438 RepID=U5QHI8_GLOK1|nr:UDP-glucose 4-epimerase GalE [Gloeobacter kilaueensis]AGY58432.1 UDP-glucose 4-epimerase [Gloeobacter kilaueensis JS1]
MILVTGGAGYIGSHVVLALQRAGFEALVLDNLVYGHAEFVPADKLIHGELEDREKLKQLFADHPIEAVIHMAAYAYVGESVTKPAIYYRNNIYGTLCLLEAMVEAGVGKIVFSSTCATYGEPDQIPIPESHPQRPINPYGFTKLVVEQMLRDFDRAYGLRSVVFRYFNAAGAEPDGQIGEDHNPETHLIPLVLDVAIGRRPHITVFGDDYATVDGTCVRDYIHVSDLADAHVLGLKYLRTGGETTFFNLGNGNGFSVQQVIDAARQITGKPIAQVLGARRPGDPAQLVGGADRARQVLGWSPRFADIETIIATAWRWHQSRFGKD